MWKPRVDWVDVLMIAMVLALLLFVGKASIKLKQTRAAEKKLKNTDLLVGIFC